MSNLILFKPEKQNLTEIGFVKDTPSQIKIRDIKDSYELNKSITIIIIETYNRLGIKGEITDFNAKDIKDLILTNFKGYSLDEIAYAFKLERHGLTWEKTQHFQLFNAEYVGAVLRKYSEWKRKVRVEHNISTPVNKELTFSESEKKRLTSNAIRKSLDHFLAHLSLPSGYLFIYEELYRLGLLNKDTKIKKTIYNSAIELLEQEYKEKKAGSREEHLQHKKIYENLRKPKQDIVIAKCKELSIIRFFRSLRADEVKLESFTKEYQIKN